MATFLEQVQLAQVKLGTISVLNQVIDLFETEPAAIAPNDIAVLMRELNEKNLSGNPDDRLMEAFQNATTTYWNTLKNAYITLKDTINLEIEAIPEDGG